MYKSIRILLFILLSFVLLTGNCKETTPVFAVQAKASVTIEFTGDEAELAGFAQSKITVTPVEGGIA